MTYIGPLGPTLQQAYVDMVLQLNELEEYQMTGLPVIEIYRTTEVNPRYALNQTDIYLPVKKIAKSK